MKPVCIIIAGPTAVGKTQLAVDVAHHFNTSIISADSRQCYQELSIGVAKPDALQLAAVPHYFIGSHSIHQTVNAADFESYALKTIDHLFEKNKIVIMAGGTGLYLRAFEKGLDLIPAVEEKIRIEVIQGYEDNGKEWLQQCLINEDSLYAQQGEMQNPQRMMRALEVVRSTGKSIVSFQQNQTKERPFDMVKIGLELPREILYERINQRVDAMMAAGLEEEARSVYSFRSLNALQTVGYSELFEYFDGKISRAQSIELIKQHTRNYAKRQMTWFKKDTQMKWFSPDVGDVIAYIRSQTNLA